MNNQKQLGIWMDHSTANLIDLDSNKGTKSISSEFTFDTKEEALSRSESIMHNKRQQMPESFYKTIGSQILKYEHVLLFGPTNAKVELHNFIKKDVNYKNIKIDIESADKMTDNEKVAFVKKHFNN